MKTYLFFLMAFCAISFSACEEMDDEHEHAEESIDMDALRAELQTMEDAYAKAQNAKDAEAVVAYYADDAQSLPPNKPTEVGKAAILAMTKKDLAEDETGATSKYEVVDVFADGNLAVEVGRSITTKPDGSKSYGKYMSVFENRNGKWICIRDMYSDDAEEDDDDGDDDDDE